MHRGLVASRSRAQEAIAAGLVTVDGAPALKAARQVLSSAAIVVAAPPRRFVGRGGEKLDAALDRFDIDVAGRRCLDAGASTGGFTDCLLQRGAGHVTAVDVGYGQIAHRLRVDERVTVLERTNVRYLDPGDVPAPPPEVVVADLSFISLRLVLPALRAVAAEEAEAVLLVKPQFEAGPGDVGDGGVVRDRDVWLRAVAQVASAAREVAWPPVGAMPSPLVGAAGNVEFLLHLSDGAASSPDVDRLAAAAVNEVDPGGDG